MLEKSVNRRDWAYRAFYEISPHDLMLKKGENKGYWAYRATNKILTHGF